MRLIAYIVTDKENTSADVKGRAKLLGEALLEIQPYRARLTNISEDGLRIPLVFKREDSPVGRLVVDLKLVGEDILPHKYLLNNLGADEDTTEGDIKLNKLPSNIVEPGISYRVRLNVYSAFGLKQGNELPS